MRAAVRGAWRPGPHGLFCPPSPVRSAGANGQVIPVVATLYGKHPGPGTPPLVPDLS